MPKEHKISSQVEIKTIIEEWARATLNNLVTNQWREKEVSEVARLVVKFNREVNLAKKRLKSRRFRDKFTVIDAAGDIINTGGSRPSDRHRGRRIQ